MELDKDFGGMSNPDNLNTPCEKHDNAIAELQDVVGNLACTTDDLKINVGKASAVARQLNSRYAQLEEITKELQRYLFTGNGQPSLTQQLAVLKTQITSIMEDLKGFADNSVSEKTFQIRMSGLEAMLHSIQETQAEFKVKVANDKEKYEATRLQIIICVIGGLMGLVSVIISAAIDLYSK